jgi:hypothetical protein
VAGSWKRYVSVLVSVLSFAYLAPIAASATAAPMECDTLASVDSWSYCLRTVSGTPTTYAATRSHDGVHWGSWALSLETMTGQLKVQFFGRVGQTWYLQDYAAGLFSSTDGHAFTPVDPVASNGQLTPSEAVTGVFDGKPALWLANSGGMPAVVPESAAALPVAGLGAETDLFIPTSSGSVMAIGRSPAQASSVTSPLSVAACDAIGQCLQSPSPLPVGMTAIEAVGPSGAPHLVLIGGQKQAVVYLAGSRALVPSPALTRLVGDLQPGANPRQFQIGWAAVSSSDWFIRIAWMPDITSGVRPAPGDLILEGNPAKDQWHVIAFAPAIITPAYRNIGGTRAPWSAAPCNQPLGSAISWSRSAGLLVQVCTGVGGRLYRSTDHGRHWTTVR